MNNDPSSSQENPVSQAMENVKSTAKDIAEMASEKAGEVLQQAQGSATHAAQDLWKSFEDSSVMKSALKSVKEKPLKALIVAFCVGAGLGLSLR
jgi:hypothetical protein